RSVLVSAGLAVSGGLAAGAFGVLVGDIAAMDFTAQDHAYGSIFFTLGGFVLVMAAITAVLDGFVLWQSLHGRFTTRRHAPVANAARFGVAAAVVWAVGLGTLYVVPAVA
ncbi:MAG: hypothetical protein KY443_04730, partial [Actinobacteria bacterium]|nr:hypothetical protein [Actinomycetota bacterium]